MYKTADTEKKKAVGGLLLSAALTSMLTGITEPLEFTFLFVAPLLYGIHCVLAGAAYMLMHVFEVGVGNDIFRRIYRYVPVWHNAGKCKDKLDMGSYSRCSIFYCLLSVLFMILNK